MPGPKDTSPLPHNPKEPLLVKRANGFGWDLNFNNPNAYFILVVILGIPIIVAAWAIYVGSK